MWPSRKRRRDWLRSGDAPAVSLVCQTGTRDFDMVREAFQRSGVQGRVERFIDAMDREVKRRRA